MVNSSRYYDFGASAIDFLCFVENWARNSLTVGSRVAQSLSNRNLINGLADNFSIFKNITKISQEYH